LEVFLVPLEVVVLVLHSEWMLPPLERMRLERVPLLWERMQTRWERIQLFSEE